MPLKSAVETVAGAPVHGLKAEDKPRIEAFMRGLDRTRHLAFGHPGLGTSAARSGAILIIQNDIGATDAHVVVVHVEGLTITVTYTDVHRARAKFFMDLLANQHVEWTEPVEEAAASLGTTGQFLLIKGRRQVESVAGVDSFLEFFGSRLVFMIDWNKCRKALRNFISDEASKDVLRWAAAQAHGHRALLELGGAEPIYEAVRRLDPVRVPYGVRLDSVLGTAKTVDFLKRTLRIASEGLLDGRSAHLLKDEIQALLASEFETLESAFFTVVVRHLGESRMMAGLIENAFPGGGLATWPDRKALAAQSGRLEHKADQLTREARELASRLVDPRHAGGIIEAAEDANDALEEASFLLSLVPENGIVNPLNKLLSGLAEIAKSGTGHLIRAVEASSHLGEGRQADVTDALQSIDAVNDAEKKADNALRQTMAAFVAATSEARSLFLGIEIARAIETCTDHLSRSALALRDRILNGLKA